MVGVKSFISLLACVSLFSTFSTTLEAQGVAAGGGLGIPLYLPDMIYESSAVPSFLFGMQGTGRATQSITLERSFRPSAWGSVEWFPGAHAGLLARGLFRRIPLAGTNPPYKVTVDYTASQPPDNIPRQFHNEFSTAWPDTTGHLDRWEFDAAATFAATSTSGVRAHVDGGLAFIGTSGSFGPVGLTTFQLGGHSVLFSNQYELVLGLSRKWAVAGVASGGVTIPFGGHAGLEVSGRVILPRIVSAEVSVLSVGGDAISALTPSDAQRALQPAPLDLKLGTIEVLIGLRLH